MVYFPLHALGWALCRLDPFIFNLIFRASECAYCPNQKLWGCKSYEPCELLKKVRREVGISKHIPITHLNSPSIFEAKNGMMGSVLKIAGIPFATETSAKLNQYKKLWHHALTMLDERFCVMQTLHRRKENIELQGSFDNDFAIQLDNAYQQQFKSRSLYVNDIYLTLIYKEFTSGKVGKSLSFLQTLNRQSH